MMARHIPGTIMFGDPSLLGSQDARLAQRAERAHTLDGFAEGRWNGQGLWPRLTAVRLTCGPAAHNLATS